MVTKLRLEGMDRGSPKGTWWLRSSYRRGEVHLGELPGELSSFGSKLTTQLSPGACEFTLLASRERPYPADSQMGRRTSVARTSYHYELSVL
jgi:hypothetical protein